MASEVERALVAAVRAAPDRWDAWLVFADWLTEQGDARGQLIAWEHQLAVAPLSADERTVLQRQVDALARKHQEEWLTGWTPPAGARLEWCYGFLVGVRLPWDEGTLAVLDALIAHPTAGLLAKLDLGGNDIGEDGAAALAASRVLSSLTALGLMGNGIGDLGTQALVASGSLGSLTWLDLSYNSVTDQGARALAAADSLRSLAALDLGENNIGDPGVRALAASRSLGSLTTLDLAGNRISDRGVRALVASDALSSLTALNLLGNDISAAGARTLRAWESRRGCRVEIAWPRNQR
jgi:uncharacterized protein (TIGR02996 family)